MKIAVIGGGPAGLHRTPPSKTGWPAYEVAAVAREHEGRPDGR